MTIHAAKGLEFDHVFLPGWEEGVFPSQRALDEGGLASLEEERRLAYVAITRARRRCTILHAANRRIYGQWTSSIPSRFIAELPAEHIDAGNHADRRRLAVARATGRETRRPLRPRRPRPARAHRDPRPRLAARGRDRLRPRAQAPRRTRPQRRQLRRQAARRHRGRRARVPRQVRLRRGGRPGRQQARDRVRDQRAASG